MMGCKRSTGLNHVVGMTGGCCGGQVGTLNYMAPEAILGGSSNIRGAPPMKVSSPPLLPELHVILPAAFPLSAHSLRMIIAMPCVKSAHPT